MKYNIKKFDPCKEALIFYNSFETSEEAWEKCERGDWMLWIAQNLQVDVRKLVLAKSLCAYTVKHLMKERSKNAIYVAFKYGRGKATKTELNAAYADAADVANAAYAYADATYAYAADAAYAVAYAVAYAANANADATDVANAVAYAANAAAYAANANADATYAAADAKKENQMKTANICRKILTEEVFKKIKE
jgi:predicted alpha/beta hydrolase family esterase